jgi:hypothetical protein
MFCYNYSADLHRNSRWRTLLDFFCSDATLVQKICSDVFGVVSGKIILLEFFCYDASIVKKNSPSPPARSSARSALFCFEPFFVTMKQKWSFFLFHGSNFGILVRNIFAPFIQFFCYNEPFFASMKQMQDLES